MTDEPRPILPDPDDELSAEEIRQQHRREKIRRVLLIAIPSIVILILAALMLIPHIRDWRAQSLAGEARELLRSGKTQEAYLASFSALQLSPENIEVRRVHATVLAAAGSPEALEVHRQILASPGVSPADRVNYANAALQQGRADLAASQVEPLLAPGGDPAAGHLLQARLDLAANRPNEAAAALRQSIDSGGGQEPVLLLARLMLAQGPENEAATEEALKLLQPLLSSDQPGGLEALFLLLGTHARQRPEAMGWINAVQQHPAATDEQKLSAAAVEIELDPRRQREVVAREIALYKDTPPERRIFLGRWLNQQREYDAVLEVIPLEMALERNDLFLVWLDATAGKGDWATIESVLKRNDLPLQAPLVLLFRGRAARELGQPEAATGFYRRAVIEAARTPDVMWYVIGYMKRVGEDSALEGVLMSLTENPATARQAFEALVPIVQTRQNAEELYKLYDRMVKRLPADKSIQNDHRYFATLAGAEPDVEGALALANSDPRMFAYRITLAMTLLKAGRNQEALGVFQDIPDLKIEDIQPYQRGVLALVLAANGRTEDARQIVGTIPAGVLTDREIELLKPLLPSGR